MTDKSNLNKDRGFPSTNSSTQITSMTQILKKYKSQGMYSNSPMKNTIQIKQTTNNNDNSASTAVKFQTAVKENSNNSSKTNIISLRAMTLNKMSPENQRNQLNAQSDNTKPYQIELDLSTSQPNQTKKPHTSLDKIMSDGSFQELDTEGNSK